METFSHSFFVEQFREFYREVVRLKSRALNESWHPASPSPGEDVPPTQVGVNPIWQRMVEVLHRLAKNAGYKGSPCVAEAYKELQFVMVALADEVFLHLDWPGQASWQANLLESKFFHSAVGGERVFHKIEQLLDDRHVGCGEMAVVYLMALSLGFRGKYWGVDDHGKLDEYREELYALAFHRKPHLLTSTTHLFPEAYAHVLSEGPIKKLTNPKKWLVGLGAGAAIFVVLAHGVWLHATQRISHVIHEILAVG